MNTPHAPRPASLVPSLLSTIHYPLITALCLLLTGCPKSEPSQEKQSPVRPLQGIKLKLAVVDDPAMAASVARLRGEWNAQTGAELDVLEFSEKELMQTDSLAADAAICPSHLLGVLAERNAIAPVPQRVLRSPQWGEILELQKTRETAWAKQTMAVPFGSPVMMCCYRADLLEKIGRRPPRTWTEYNDLAKLLAAQKTDGADVWSGAIEPLKPGWAAISLLARAAAYCKHRDNYSALFDIETLDPLIAGPPFELALEELVAAAKFGPQKKSESDPTDVRKTFWRGQCGMAITWPTAAMESRGERGERRAETLRIRVGFVELPGAARVFNYSGGVWDDRAEDDDRRVSLLGVAGRLGVVGKQSPHIDAAFQLLLWLSDDQTSVEVSSVSPATTLFRRSHLKFPAKWVEKSVPASAAVQYADAVDSAMRRQQSLDALRIPGRAEYLAALDDAVLAAVGGQKTPLDALLQVDSAWRKISARLGLDYQRAAYRHSLGLE